MPVGEPRKRRRVRKLAVERRQKIKNGTRGIHGSRKKVFEFLSTCLNQGAKIT
jgi:hypothetical protein